MSLENKVKESNPKDVLGVQKTPFSTISFPVMAELGVAMLEGSLKYGRHNYRSIGVRTSVYIDAAMRHLAAYWEGESVDPDSGLSHLVKAIASLAVLRDAEVRGLAFDDRPTGTTGFIDAMNLAVKGLLQKYPDPKPPFIAEKDPDKYKGA